MDILKAKTLGLGLIALLTAGCSQSNAEVYEVPTQAETPVETVDPSEAFLNDVEGYFPDSGLNTLAESTRLTWADSACGYLDQGMSPGDLTFYLSSDGLLTQYDADMGVRVAVDHICPEHKDKVNTDHYGN